jgi:3-oxoadipate enol-lactonase
MPFGTTRDGTRIFYEITGAGLPLLLVSGQASDHHMWDPILPDFTSRFQVITADYRGTGESDTPLEKPYSTRGFAQDLIEVLDAAGIRHAFAYGISMGGRVCQWLAIDHADRIKAIVLGATTPGNRHGIPRSAEIASLLQSGDIAAMANLMASPEWLAKHASLMIPPTTSTAARLLHFQASEEHDTWDFLPAIKVPTLVIHGNNDRVNETANAALLVSRIPNAETAIIDGGRHAYFLEFREEASRIVCEFLIARSS